jgi:uncharacterized protein (TIGR02246 family)
MFRGMTPKGLFSALRCPFEDISQDSRQRYVRTGVRYRPVLVLRSKRVIVPVPTYADETAIRSLYQRMLDAWGDAKAYAECFTPEADYIYGAGGVQHGWKEIIDGHNIAFSGWARTSRLEGRIDRLRFITDDVALLLGYGHVVYLDDRSSDQNKRTVYTLVAQRLNDRWLFAGYQNTPLGKH